MAPKKKPRACHSHDHQFRASNPSEDNFWNTDLSQTILHRLRPRVHGSSEIIHKVCPPKKRYKGANGPTIKRCYTRKTRRRGCRRNWQKKISLQAAGDVKPRNIFVGSNQSSGILALQDSSGDTNQEKPPSYIQSIMEYIISTFRGGTKWAARCVYQAFKSDSKNRRESSRISIKEDRIRDAISLSHVTETGKRITDKRKIKRCTANDKSNHRELERRTRSCSVTGNFSRKENPGSLCSASKEGSRDCRCRVRNARCQTSVSNCNVLKKRKVHHAKSSSEHFGGRKKKGGRKKWIAPSTSRYNKTPALFPRRHYQIRDSLRLINLENIIEDIGSRRPTVEEEGKNFPSKFDNENKTEELSNQPIDFNQPDENNEEYFDPPTIRDGSFDDKIKEN